MKNKLKPWKHRELVGNTAAKSFLVLSAINTASLESGWPFEIDRK